MANKIEDLAGDVIIAPIYVPGQATAGTADEWPGVVCPFNAKVTAVKYVPVSAVAGAATNHFSLQVRNRAADATGTTDVATLAFDGGVDAAAWEAKEITLNATAANLEVDAGEILTVEKVVVGTGMPMPEGVVQVQLQAR